MIIGARFNGPPGSGNGGYSSGALAAELGEPLLLGAEVTLRLPPPLDTLLELRSQEDGSLGAFDGDALVAYAGPSIVDDDPVEPVELEVATRAAEGYVGFHHHPFPTCYVCGPERVDGLRIFPGRITPERTAAPFVVPADITPVVMWAALDCPGGWAAPFERRAYVLGRIAARVDELPRPGNQCVTVGQLVGESGRKVEVRSSIYGPAGELLATARATWIALP